MTNKVQKIREKVERLKSSLLYGACASQVAMETRCKEEAYNEVFAILDTMQEPVNEDLDIAASEYLKQNYDIDNIYEEDDLSIRNTFKAGAQWQKEQFEKNRLEHCNSITEEQYNLEVGFIDQHLDKYNRMPTFLDAIEYGMKLQKQQMVANAIDGTFSTGELADGTPIDAIFNFDKVVGNKYEEGEKVKVIVI